MTYQDLLNALLKMTPEQLQCDLTVEVPVDFRDVADWGEFYFAELKIYGDYPVILVKLQEQDRGTNGSCVTNHDCTL